MCHVNQASAPHERLLQKQPEGEAKAVVPPHRLCPFVSHTPHGQVEKPAVSWLHPEDRALLEHERVRSEDGQEIVRIVASHVAHEGVEGAPTICMQRHRKDHRCIVLCDPAELKEGLPIILNMLDNVERADQVKAVVWKRQGRHCTKYRKTAARLQAGESRPTDVDEGRAGNGESRTQPRADFESRRCRGCERGEKRPGVEALRQDHGARRPERIVEVSVDGNGRARHVLRASRREGASEARGRAPVPTDITLV